MVVSRVEAWIMQIQSEILEIRGIYVAFYFIAEISIKK